MTARDGRRSGPGFLRWFGWALLLAPLTILLHELGHLVTATALGFPGVELHFSSISHGDIGDRPSWQEGLVGLAGPAVTAILLLAGLFISSRRPRSAFGFALAVAAASRFLVGVPYTLANLVAQLSGGDLPAPGFDEYKAGEALGWSGDLTLGLTAALVLLVIVWLAYRLPRGSRLSGWLGLIGGTIAGWAVWFALAPALLP